MLYFPYKMHLQDATSKAIRSPKRRVRDDDFMFGLSSDHARIVFILTEAIQRVSTEILKLNFRGRRSIC